jgi:viroplasmin and RNaseH domain-containing protein
MTAWVDELILISQQPLDERVNDNGFENQQLESKTTVFCNKKSVGYSEYFKSQQTGKVVEAKCEVHKADYGGEDTVEMDGRRFYVLKTYELDEDTIELSLTDLRNKESEA